MKKTFVLILLSSIAFSLFGNQGSYRPVPIIWVHGLGGSSVDWGVGVYKSGEVKTDSIHSDSIKVGSTFDKFIHDYFYPYYAESLEIWYPNHTRLEVINFDYNNGSIDPDSGIDPWLPYCDQPGQGWELRQRIKEVLAEYYGPNWQNDPEAKVIIIAHSMGCASSREVIREEPALAAHIKKFVLLDGANNGSYAADAQYIVFPALAICAHYAPTLLGRWILAAGSAASIFLPLFMMNAYHDATWDLRSFITLGFIPQLNQATQTPPPGVEWACLVGRDPWPAGLAGTTMGAIGTAIILAGDWVLGGAVIASGLTLEWWNHNSDLVIQTNSQDIAAKACPNYQREMIEDDCLAHADALKKWEYIRDFLEPPVSVSIDSVIVFKGGERTAYALPNVNDTIKSPGDSIFLKGRTNVYFLASAEAKISLNGSGYLTMQWPSALGREGQGFFYKIPQEYLFVPENYIEVKIKSVDSDNQTNTGLATTSFDNDTFSFSREGEKTVFVDFLDIDVLNCRNIIVHLEEEDG